MNRSSNARAARSDLTCEARRVLPFLYGATRVLAPIDQRSHGVFGKESSEPFVTVERPVVSDLAAEEFIEPEPGQPRGARRVGKTRFVLSRIGHAFLKRKSAGNAAFAAQHRLVVTLTDAEGTTIGEINAWESPLAWLRTRRTTDGAPYLSDAEYRAGEKLREDFTFALMTPKSTASWPLERVDYSHRTDFSPAFDSDRANDARRRFWNAIDAAGSGLGPILIATCCHLQGLEAIEAKLGLPKRSGKAVLKLGLACLARHYGMIGRAEQNTLIRSRSFGELPMDKNETKRGEGSKTNMDSLGKQRGEGGGGGGVENE